jgi:uncharacterized protein YidB (DUF937 family)
MGVLDDIFGSAINSWIGTGPNKSVAPGQISNAIGESSGKENRTAWAPL